MYRILRLPRALGFSSGCRPSEVGDCWVQLCSSSSRRFFTVMILDTSQLRFQLVPIQTLQLDHSSSKNKPRKKHRHSIYIYIIYLDVPEGLVFLPLSPNLPFLSKRRFFDFWSVLSLQMSFSRVDASFPLKFEDVFQGQG